MRLRCAAVTVIVSRQPDFSFTVRDPGGESTGPRYIVQRFLQLLVWVHFINQKISSRVHVPGVIYRKLRLRDVIIPIIESLQLGVMNRIFVH